ncbi:MAG: fumarylacetoacetate hydrolase family protein [Flavobacteriales bacterium]|nr:fumarylacetoacetate hydrolase family protein [Bacteroidota bacterium]MCB9240576.1 fumarylacetoacetate hydrolase family protein [Flavobacteriales bacterium]
MKIICVGRNYQKHAEELGNAIPEEPVIFLKPDSSLMRQRDAFYIPDWTNDVHYEAELVVRIGRNGKNIEERFARKYYDQVTVGIDFTARDVQSALKSKGLPWEKSKGFDGSAVCGQWIDLGNRQLGDLRFSLTKNDQQVQDGNPNHMLFGVDALIAHVSRYFTLKMGDMIFTGTPEGVGPVAAGDVLEGFLNNEKVLRVRIK